MAAQKPSYTTSVSPSPTTSLLGNSTAYANSSLVPPRWTWNRDPFWNAVYTSMQISGTLQAILIISTNLLLLLVILSSPLLRSRMRNKLVINVVIASLMVGILGAPFTVDYTMRGKWVHSCYFTVILVILCAFVQNFISMWGVVALLLHYVARLLRYEGPAWLERLPLLLQRALPALLIASPWILSVVVLVPMIFGGLDRNVLSVWSYNTCPFVLERWAQYVLNVFSYFIPALVLIALIVVILLLHRRREEKVESPSRMEMGPAVMSDTAQELETYWVHVLVAVLTVLMMGPEHVFLAFKRGPWKHIVIASVIVHLLSDLLPFVVALVWLVLLPDVRGHVKELGTKLSSRLMLVCCRTRSPPQAPGSTSISPMAFKDLQDE